MKSAECQYPCPVGDSGGCELPQGHKGRHWALIEFATYSWVKGRKPEGIRTVTDAYDLWWSERPVVTK